MGAPELLIAFALAILLVPIVASLVWLVVSKRRDDGADDEPRSGANRS